MKEIGPIAEIDHEIIMKGIGPIAGTDHKITMKETGLIAGTDRENTMTEINHTEGIDWQSITKMIMKESIIIHFRIMEIGENIKISIKTNTGIKISMIMIDPMIQIILIVEIDCKAITENLKTRDMREGLKTIIKTGTARIIIEIVTKTKISTKTKTDIRMTAMARLEGLKREITYMMRMTYFTQKLKGCTKSYKQ